MQLKLCNLEKCFESAIKQNRKYIGVKIMMQDFDECEVIINPRKNFENKLEYYKNAYNDDLTLKTFNGIKIVGFTFGDTYESIEEDLIGVVNQQCMNIKVKIDIDKQDIDTIVSDVVDELNKSIANKVKLSIG